MTYYDESIAYMCDTPEDYRKMQHHFEKIDVEYGCPNTLEAPSQVILNWSRWAHARALNAGCFRGDSYKWLLEKEVNVRSLEMDKPSFMKRHPVDTPDGLFPQNWLEPEEPDEMRTEAQLLAALVLDDYDHRASTDFVAPNVPVYEELDVEARIREAGLWFELPSTQVEAALTHTQGGVPDQMEFDQDMPDHSDPRDSMTWVDQDGATVYLSVPGIPVEANAQMSNAPVESVSTIKIIVNVLKTGEIMLECPIPFLNMCNNSDNVDGFFNMCKNGQSF
eukprot:3315060-Amphidinium_carterae.1